MADVERARMLATHGDPQVARQTITTITKRPLSPALIEQAVTDNLGASPAAWRAWLEQGSREDIAARMERIDTRTNVIVGAADPIISPQLLERDVLTRLDVTHMDVVPGVGHLLPLEAPQAIVHRLNQMMF
jgi:pimeloyl-ACP methyl ester carboxylesterase